MEHEQWAILERVMEDDVEGLLALLPDRRQLKNMHLLHRHVMSHACRHGSVRVIGLLVELGFKIDSEIAIASKALSLPLIYCARGDVTRNVRGRFLLSMECLIRLGADLEKRDRDGFTALGKAIEYGFVDAVRVLVQSGADQRRVLHVVLFKDHRVPERYRTVYRSANYILRGTLHEDHVKEEIGHLLSLPSQVRLAFAMGQHPRLGAGSLVNRLDGGLVRMIHGYL